MPTLIFSLFRFFSCQAWLFSVHFLWEIIIISDGKIKGLSQPIWFSTNALLIVGLRGNIEFSFIFVWILKQDIWCLSKQKYTHQHRRPHSDQAVKLHYLNSRYKTQATFYLLFFILGISWCGIKLVGKVCCNFSRQSTVATFCFGAEKKKRKIFKTNLLSTLAVFWSKSAVYQVLFMNQFPYSLD